MRKVLVAAALLAAGLPAAEAQQRAWSLRECIDYALEHNISVRRSGLGVEQKEVDLNTALSRRLPGVSASASENLSFGRGLTADNTYSNANTTSTSFSLGADLPIFQGFDISNGIKLAKLDLQTATLELERAKDDVRVAVAQAYIQILYNKEILQVALEQVARDSVQTERIKAMEATGKVSSAEVAAQQASLEQTRLSSVQARNNLNIALLDLSQLLELESPEGFDVASPPESMLQPGLLMSPEAVYEQAVTIKPVILSGELAVESAKIAIDRAKGAGLPSLSLSGGIGTNFYTNSLGQSASFGSQLEKNFSQYVGLSLRVPIFQRFSVRNNVKNARIGLMNQELQLESARKSLFKEIQQAYYNAVAAQAKCTSSQAAAQSAEQAFVLTREKYDNGKANVTEYNDSRARYLEAQSNYLQARYEAVYQEKLLDFYRGQPLAF